MSSIANQFQQAEPSGDLEHIAKLLMMRASISYHEDSVVEAVQEICRHHELHLDSDSYGNLMVEVKRGRSTRPLVMVAHLDHPGFEILSRIKGSNNLRAKFLGGVGPAYFKKGTKLKLFPGGLSATLGKKLKIDKEYQIHALSECFGTPQFGVWDLESFKIKKGRIHGRACDDLIGVAAILASLIQLKQFRSNFHVVGLLTRAEEVGFHGALAAASRGTVDRQALIVSLETSKEIPPVKMGQGVILRVGDRTSVFDAKATRFFSVVADDLARRDPAFRFQRALMSGGSCEATAFQEFGYSVAAVCVPLGHYHNCGPNTRIMEEFVDRKDVDDLVKLMVGASLRMRQFPSLVSRLSRKMNEVASSACSRLQRKR